VGNSGVTGELTIFKTATKIIGAGRAIGLEASLSDTNKGTASYTRGIAVHSGDACTDETLQGGVYFDNSGSDAWANIGYSSTSPEGSTDFMFSVTTALRDIANKPFIVRNNAGGRVACGVIGGPYDIFTAVLQPLNGGAVTGDVTVFVTPEGLLGVGSASGNAAGGVAIHAGTGCTNQAAQGAQYYEATTPNPWTSSTYPSTEANGDATYSFSVKTLAKDILGKPFIVRNNAGALVACGTLGRMTGAKTATLAPLNGDNAQPNGKVTIYTTATKIVGAGAATGLAANVDSTATGLARRVAVVSGNSCNNPTGGHYFAAGGSDPWAETGYSSTDSAGTAAFVFSIQTSAVDIVGKPFIMYNNAAEKAACGLVVAPPTSPTTTAGPTAGSPSGSTTVSPAAAAAAAATATSTGNDVTSGCSGMPAFSMIVVLFAGMLLICAEL